MARTSIISILVALYLGAAVPVLAQRAPRPVEEARSPEAFFHIGRFRVGSDEGSIGSGPSYGGTLTVPIWQRLAVEVDVQTSHVVRRVGQDGDLVETRRTLLIPSLLYRFGHEAVYGFVGAGTGVEFGRSASRFSGIESEQSRVEPKVAFRVGAAGFPLSKLGLRGDVFMAMGPDGRIIPPGWHVGIRFGIGYRFK
jgi:hypothetical protein